MTLIIFSMSNSFFFIFFSKNADNYLLSRLQKHILYHENFAATKNPNINKIIGVNKRVRESLQEIASKRNGVKKTITAGEAVMV